MKNIFGLLLVAGLAVPALADQPASVSRDDVRAMVSEMMSDAETRSSLLQGGATGGYDRNFFLASADNKYRLSISGFTQIRYTANVNDTDNTLGGVNAGNPALGADGTGSDYRGGFNLRRTVVAFNGNAGSESLKYSVRIASVDGQNLRFDDAFVAYELGSGWSVKAGQYKVGFTKESLNSDVYTMAADRGFVDAYFGQGRSQGASLYYRSDAFDASFDLTDGLKGENRPTFGEDSDSTSNNRLAADYAFTGRGEYRFAGTRAQLQDYTSRQDEKFAGNVGFAGHFQGDANNNDTTASLLAADQPSDTNIFGYTIDAQVEGGGFGAFIALVGTHSEQSFLGGGNKFKLDDFGFVAQANYRILAETDLFAKYEMIVLDKDRTTGTPAREVQRYTQFVTAGANQYFAGNAAKLTADVVVGLNHTADLAGQQVIGGPGFNGNALGLTGTNKGAEIALRVQLQVMF